MQVFFDVLWLIGEAGSAMFIVYGGSLTFGYPQRASRGASLTTSNQAATAN
jgi:hypothetical protein